MGEEERWAEAGSSDAGSASDSNGGASAGRQQSGSAGEGPGSEAEHGLRLAGYVSSRRMGRAEGETGDRPAQENQRRPDAMGIYGGGGQQSVTAPLRVRAVDAADDSHSAVGTVSAEAEFVERRATARATRPDLSTAPVSSQRTR